MIKKYPKIIKNDPNCTVFSLFKMAKPALAKCTKYAIYGIIKPKITYTTKNKKSSFLAKFKKCVILKTTHYSFLN